MRRLTLPVRDFEPVRPQAAAIALPTRGGCEACRRRRRELEFVSPAPYAKGNHPEACAGRCKSVVFVGVDLLPSLVGAESCAWEGHMQLAAGRSQGRWSRGRAPTRCARPRVPAAPDPLIAEGAQSARGLIQLVSATLASVSDVQCYAMYYLGHGQFFCITGLFLVRRARALKVRECA